MPELSSLPPNAPKDMSGALQGLLGPLLAEASAEAKAFEQNVKTALRQHRDLLLVVARRVGVTEAEINAIQRP